MFRSFRWRIQLWHTLILVVVVGTFGGVLYWNARAAKLREIDAELLAGAQVLAAAVSNLPPHELEGSNPRAPRPRPPRDGRRPPPGPPRDEGPTALNDPSPGESVPGAGQGRVSRRPPPPSSERIL